MVFVKETFFFRQASSVLLKNVGKALLSCLVFSLVAGCASVPKNVKSINLFAERQQLGDIEYEGLNEISGLAASQKNIGVIWAHNDSGDGSNIYAMTNTGRHLAKFSVSGCFAFDWEDVALGPGPEVGVDYLYIGDIGDNLAIRPSIQICRVTEPDMSQSYSGVSVLQGELITLTYPDGARDAEALLVDATTKDLYIVSKREEQVAVFVASYPHDLVLPVLLIEVAVLPLTSITGGDISYDGQEVLLRTYSKVFYWRRRLGESVAAMLQRLPAVISSYRREAQGEAIAWAPAAEGFYTTSEEVLGMDAVLYYYPKLDSVTVRQP